VSEIKLTAEQRTEFGKGAARRIRRAAKIPAVIYGHGEPPQHVTLPGHDTMLALKHSNALLSLTIGGGTPLLALVKDVQRNPVRPEIEHVDLVVVRRGEKVEVEVAVHLTGEAAPETVVTLDHTTLLLEAEATNIPQTVEVSVEGLVAGTQIHAGDVALPAGSRLVTDADALVLVVGQARTAEDLEAELGEAEAELGIVHEASHAEAEAPAAADTEGAGEAASRPTAAADDAAQA
jgi:large subunit ribosomal protein L25